jgi:hypothetical protein
VASREICHSRSHVGKVVDNDCKTIVKQDSGTFLKFYHYLNDLRLYSLLAQMKEGQTLHQRLFSVYDVSCSSFIWCDRCMGPTVLTLARSMLSALSVSSVAFWRF